MKTYLVEYVYPRTQQILHTYIQAKDKKEAEITFHSNFPEVQIIERITWVPSILKN